MLGNEVADLPIRSSDKLFVVSATVFEGSEAAASPVSLVEFLRSKKTPRYSVIVEFISP